MMKTSTFSIWYPIYFLLAVLGGLLATFFSLYAGIGGGSSGGLVFSRIQLGFALGLLALTAGFGALALKGFLDRSWLERLDRRLRQLLDPDHRLLTTLMVLLNILSVSVALIVLWQVPTIHQFSWYSKVAKHSLVAYQVWLVVFERALPALIWSAALALQSLIFLVYGFLERIREKGFFELSWILKAGFVLLTLTLTVFHWAVLAFQLPVFVSIPGWYWEIYPRGFTVRDGLFVLVAGLALLLVAYLLRRPKPAWRTLSLLVVFGYLLQVSFGFIEGSGFEYVRLKYAGSNHKSYAITASSEAFTPGQVVRDYEALFGQRMFPSTKPPGVILGYVLFEKIVHAFSPQPTSEARFVTLTTWMAYLFPLLSFLVVFAIYALLRPYLPVKKAILPPMLYLFLPNILLIPLFLDQVLYPLLFVLGALLILLAIRRRSILLAFAAGCYYYIAIFLSFSMLPLLPLFLALIGLDFLAHPGRQNLFRSLGLTLGLGAGIALVFVILQAGFNYNFFTRYTTAQRVVRNFDFVLRVDRKTSVDLSKTTVQPGLQQRLQAIWLNNVEFAAAVGFPMFMLFLAHGLRTLLAFLRHKWGDLEVILGAYLATYLAMNVYSLMQGEASRLWMFWTPMVVIFAALELAALFKQRRRAALLLIALQLVTIFLTFQFQDFIV